MKIAPCPGEWSKKFSDDDKHINLVIGNTSADLDSVCSSIASAWLFQCFEEKDVLYIPVVNVKRQDAFILFAVKVWLEEMCKINLEDLVFIDDPSVQKCMSEEIPNRSWSVTLVDHNLLDTRQKWLEPYVVRVIDHHQPVQFLSLLKNGEPNEIKVMDSVIVFGIGSCCTLIADKWREALECVFGMQFSTVELFQKGGESLGSSFLYLLLGPILKDTAFLQEGLRNDRWCSQDEEICTALEGAVLNNKQFNEALTKDHQSGNVRDFVKRILESAKLTLNVLLEELGLCRSFQLDFKVFDYTSAVEASHKSRSWRFGYSSFEVSLSELFSRPICSAEYLSSEISTHMAKFQLDVLVIMSFFDGQRQLGMAASSSSVDLCRHSLKLLEREGVIHEGVQVRLAWSVAMNDKFAVSLLEIRNQKFLKDSRKIVERKINRTVLSWLVC